MRIRELSVIGVLSALLGDEFLNGDESTQLAYKKSRWGEIILALPAYAKWRG